MPVSTPSRARIASAVEQANLWGLKRARAALHAAIANRDRQLPALRQRQILTLPGAEGPLEGRLYVPRDAPADAPLMLFFHGGGFVVSDLDTHEALCIRLADAGRFRILAATYRMAPEARYPAQLDDAVAITRWVLGEGASVFGPVRALAIGGDSAGAYLAASAALSAQALAPGAFRAQFLLYPYLQLDDATWAAGLLKETRALGWAASRYIRRQLAAAATAPARTTASCIAPIPALIATGGALDPCRTDAIALASSLRTAGRQVHLHEYPALAHGFGSLTHLSRRAQAVLHELGVALAAMLA